MGGTLTRQSITGPAKIAGARKLHNLGPLMKRGVTVNGTTFYTLIHDGASAEKIIEKAAREHGGGVAKIYDPKLNAYEIVAVKIGSHLLVKGDPAKVAEADFSSFTDPDSFRELAIKSAEDSSGGIHFFLGNSGIPMAAGKEGELLFPNADELCMRGGSNMIHLQCVDFNANPRSFADLDNMYSGGIRLSESAQAQIVRFKGEDIEEAHGGIRSEKLLLLDNSVLILDKDTGEIATLSEKRVQKDMPEQNFDLFDIQFKHPQQALPVFGTFMMPAEMEPMHVALDGSNQKVPYLYIKVFDGRLEDKVKINHHRHDPKPQSKVQQRKLVKGPKIVVAERFQRMPIQWQDLPPLNNKGPVQSITLQKIRVEHIRIFSKMRKSTGASYSKPRPSFFRPSQPVKYPITKFTLAIPAVDRNEPKTTKFPAAKVVRKPAAINIQTPKRQESPTIKRKAKKKPPPLKIKTRPKPGVKKKRKSSPRQQKTERIRKKMRNKFKKIKAKTQIKPPTAKPKPYKKKSRKKKKRARKPALKPNLSKRKKRRIIAKKRKKKIPSHFMREMLGITAKKRSRRTRGGSSRRRRPA